MSEQERNKKLAEWVFPDNIVKVYPCAIEVWSGKKRDELITILNPFTQDETACFKWLVPKLWVCDIKLEEGIFWFVKVAHPNYGEGKADGEDLALALCKAIEKLIDSRERRA